MDAPEVTRLSKELSVSHAEALGIITAIEAQLAEHAPDGNVTNVHDMLPQWARWEPDWGDTGRQISEEEFSERFLRAVTRENVMHRWVKANHAALAEREQSRERMRALRASRKQSGGDDTDDL